ncbi:surface antigen D15 domain-containing protein (plasmid) [Trichormus variabilis NIES-23]|uniref:Surface antigen D15 domain-containing protein n=1 Tax=Trichormus variabilis NIES-23 TaxID=1973479 RepID=A0A1Z4KWV1_ANAVA|nr:surface antigen D15 domain-containing protein [Trichormus variabilis NIES-23]
MVSKIRLLWLALSLFSISSLPNRPLNAQTVNSAQVPTLPNSGQSLPPLQDVLPIPLPRNPTLPSEQISPQSPPSSPIIQPSTPATPPSAPISGDVPGTITVNRFEIVGSTVFKSQDFEQITKDYINRPISLAELFEVRTKITKLYNAQGYITSGAYIPPQDLEAGVVKIQISEGGVEEIKVTGTRHLNPDYIRSRVALATSKPLNQNRLVEALKLLRLKDDQLIKNISAELSTGTQPGESLLEIQVTEAPIWEAQLTLDNGRTPSVGTFRRQLQLTNFDLLGLGDRLFIAYTNTDGSNSLDTSYTIPFNARNGTITLSGGFASSNVIEKPFNILDINSNSNYIELTVRQPIIQTTTQEFALGLTGSYRESGATLLGGEIPFPSPGANAEGTTRITALRFFQDYTIQNSQQVLALRSQFSFGLGSLDALNTTPNTPEDNFFVWRGQAQYVRLLAENTLLLLRGDIQLASQPLVPLEQFGLGGRESVRGYRQDLLLTDSGVFVSAEARIPILRLRNPNIVLQFTPFVDFGYGFNQGSATNPSPNDLVSVGSGLLFNMSDRLTARFDWGIPLISVSGDKSTLQEQGFYFSLSYRQPF